MASSLDETPIDSPVATPLAEIDVQTEEAVESFIPLGAGILVPRCSSPCPCCFYTLSGVHQGEFSMGWRKFGGEWSWWHKHGPHAFIDASDVTLGINGPDVPACDCCYYRLVAPGSLGPGWHRNRNGYWRWSQFQAPHVHDDWHFQGDDARFMAGRPSVGCEGPVEAMRALDQAAAAASEIPQASTWMRPPSSTSDSWD